MWKYAMIMCRRGDFEEDPIHLLVELHDLHGSLSYSDARLATPAELEMAYNDVKRDGVNHWFYDNGEFEWKCCETTGVFRWHWQKNETARLVT